MPRQAYAREDGSTSVSSHAWSRDAIGRVDGTVVRAPIVLPSTPVGFFSAAASPAFSNPASVRRGSVEIEMSVKSLVGSKEEDEEVLEESK